MCVHRSKVVSVYDHVFRVGFKAESKMEWALLHYAIGQREFFFCKKNNQYVVCIREGRGAVLVLISQNRFLRNALVRHTTSYFVVLFFSCGIPAHADDDNPIICNAIGLCYSYVRYFLYVGTWHWTRHKMFNCIQLPFKNVDLSLFKRVSKHVKL